MPGEVPSGWRREPLASLGQFLKCQGGSKKDEVPTGVPVVRYGQLYTQYDTVIRDFYSFVSTERATDYTPLKHGDVLFAGSGETLEEIGKAAVFLGQGPAHGSGDLILLRPSPAVDPLFLGYGVNGGEANEQKMRLGQGSSVFHISADRLAGLRIGVPPLPEQKKIAAILSSVDEAIQATQAVINQTRRVKEGLLQDLLTRGLPGHTRFKQTGIGEIPEAWEVRRLGDVVEPLFDDCALEPDVAYFPAIVRRRHRGVDFPESRLGAEILVKDQYRVHPGTVLFSKRQLVHGATGLVGPTVPATAIMSKEYYQLRGVRGLSTQFLSYWTRTAAFQNIAERCTYGVDREKFVVNERWFFSSPTPVPPVDEQAAIVASLDGLDSVVSGNSDRLSALQSVKYGLLQDLLTGRVRVSP